MKFSTALDVDVVAHESADEVSILIELEAPEAPTTERAPSALQIVLDRSGSMSGPPLEGAKKALAGVISRLDPHDVFGVVAFDNEAQVAVPAGLLTTRGVPPISSNQLTRVAPPTCRRVTFVACRNYAALPSRPESAAAQCLSSATDTSTAVSAASTSSRP